MSNDTKSDMQWNGHVPPPDPKIEHRDGCNALATRNHADCSCGALSERERARICTPAGATEDEDDEGVYWRGPVVEVIEPGRYVKPSDPYWDFAEYERAVKMGACRPLSKKRLRVTHVAVVPMENLVDKNCIGTLPDGTKFGLALGVMEDYTKGDGERTVEVQCGPSTPFFEDLRTDHLKVQTFKSDPNLTWRDIAGVDKAAGPSIGVMAEVELLPAKEAERRKQLVDFIATAEPRLCAYCNERLMEDGNCAYCVRQPPRVEVESDLFPKKDKP